MTTAWGVPGVGGFTVEESGGYAELDEDGLVTRADLGFRLTISGTEPAAPEINDLWLDIS